MISKELRKLYAPFYIRILMFWVKFSFNYKSKFKSQKHQLDHELVVSLTSFPARFNRLHYTLMCVLNQSVKPGRVVLWIAHEDENLLPKSVLDLRIYGLEIRFTEDIRSYKKLIPSLELYPGASFIIVDDDLYYSRNLIKRLLEEAKIFPHCVIAGRIHQVVFDSSGQIKPYKNWNWDCSIKQSKNNFYTGCGGAFFPKGVFPQDVLNKRAFLELAPTADDVWFNWMLKLNSIQINGLGSKFSFWDWPDSQVISLHSNNVGGLGNDKQIENMIRVYGQVYTSSSEEDINDSK